MSIQEGNVYWYNYDGEYWPVVALDANAAAENGIVGPEDGETYQPIAFLGSGEGMPAQVGLLSEFSWDDEQKAKTDNAGILAALEAAEALVPKGVNDEDRRALRHERNEEKQRRREEKEAKKKAKLEKQSKEAAKEAATTEEKAQKKADKRAAEKESKSAAMDEKVKKKKESKEKRARDRDDDRQEIDSPGGSDAESEGTEENNFGVEHHGDDQVPYDDRFGYGRGINRGAATQEKFTDPMEGALNRNMDALQRENEVSYELYDQVKRAYGEAYNEARHAQLEMSAVDVDAAGTKDAKLLPSTEAEYVKKTMRREEEMLRWGVIVGNQEKLTAKSKKHKNEAEPPLPSQGPTKPETPVVFDRPMVTRYPGPGMKLPRTMSTDSQPQAVSVSSGSLPTLDDVPFERRQLDDGGLMSLKTSNVMNNWLALRDRVDREPEDVHAVSAFGATAKAYDRPNIRLAERAEDYSKKRNVERTFSQHKSSGNLNDSGDALVSNTQMDFSKFEFEQTRRLDAARGGRALGAPSSVVHGESAHFKVSSTYPDPEKAGLERDNTFDRSAKDFATQSEAYQLPGSIYHRDDSNTAHLHDDDATSSVVTAGGASSAQGSNGGRASWSAAAAKVVCTELTPYLKGACGKPKLIDDVKAFRILAKSLSDRYEARCMNRKGESVAFAGTTGQTLVFTNVDKDKLTKAVRNYMAQQEQLAQRSTSE